MVLYFTVRIACAHLARQLPKTTLPREKQRKNIKKNEEIWTPLENKKSQPKMEHFGTDIEANIVPEGDLERMQRAKRATQRCMTAPSASEKAKDVENANFDPAKGPGDPNAIPK